MTWLLLLSLMFQDRTTEIFVDRIAVKVNDKIITEQEVAALYREIRKEALAKESGAELDTKLNDAWKEAVTSAEETLLLYEKAVEVGVAYSREDTMSMLKSMQESNGLSDDEFEKEVLKQTGVPYEAFIDKRMREDSARAAIQSQVMSKINFEDNEIAKYYDEHKNDYMVAATYRLAEIVFRKDAGTPAEVQEKMRACRAALTSGTEFAEAAKTYSDSFSKENGGDLGTVEYGDLLGAIEEVVKKLEAGQISENLETDASYFIIKILEKTPATPKPLGDVREAIVQNMRAPRMEKVLDEFIKELRADFVVETYVKELPKYLAH